MNKLILSIIDVYLNKLSNDKSSDCFKALTALQKLLAQYESEEVFMNDTNVNDNQLFLYKTLKLISVQKEFDWRKWKIANILFDTVCPQISFTYDKNQLKPNEVIADFDIVENLGGDRRISMEKISVVVPDNGICIDTEMTLHDKKEEGSNTCISKALNKFKRKCC